MFAKKLINNLSRCEMDIVNQIIRDYSCQPTCDSRFFIFILDLAAEDARTILRAAINAVWQACGESVTADDENHEPVEVMPDGKCHICLKNPHDLEEE